MLCESGASSIPQLRSFIATLRITGSPAGACHRAGLRADPVADDDNVRDEWSTASMQNLMKGKRGLIMGVANDHSIAWGIAKAVAAQGAELAFTYQGEALGKRVKPLAASLGGQLVLPCDVEDITSVDAVFETLRAKWGTLDFLVHAVGFSDKNELKGRYADTSRENFSRTLVISCFSFTEPAKGAAARMPERGGPMITLTYGGSTRVLPNYNVMGVAKAALEASVLYL